MSDSYKPNEGSPRPKGDTTVADIEDFYLFPPRDERPTVFLTDTQDLAAKVEGKE